MATIPPRKVRHAPRPHRRPVATSSAARPPSPPQATLPEPPTAQASTSTVRFADIPGLHPTFLQMIPFEHCTEVQAATLPVILDGHDVLAQAKTGTGKTLAFLVPSIQRLLSGSLPSAQNISILVLSPTRELAQQIAKEAERLCARRLGVQCVVGGTNMNTDVKRLGSERADILVATPGRMVDLLENGNLRPKLAQLRTLVLDEADRLLDQGFRAELTKIINALPSREQSPRQTLLFSATVAPEVHNIAALALRRDHKFVSTLKDEDINTHEHVEQESLVVPGNDLIAATYEVIKREHGLAASRGGMKIMVFLPTVGATALYHDVFSQLLLPCPVFEIHSRMTQPARTRATEAFRGATTGILFSSDVTARGIDVKGVTAVVQVGLPMNAEQYIHRLGRTARAGAKGHGILVLGAFETHFLRNPTIATLPIQPYPTPDPTSFASSQSAVSSTLYKIDNSTKAQAYQAWLGYYKSNLRALKWDAPTLVQQANEYARYGIGYGAEVSDGQWRPPGLKAQTIGKMGLKGVQGLHKLVETDSGRGGQGGSRDGGKAPSHQGLSERIAQGGQAPQGHTVNGGRGGHVPRGGSRSQGVPRGRGGGRGGRN